MPVQPRLDDLDVPAPEDMSEWPSLLVLSAPVTGAFESAISLIDM